MLGCVKFLNESSFKRFQTSQKLDILKNLSQKLRSILTTSEQLSIIKEVV